jgi:hypothetical protein
VDNVAPAVTIQNAPAVSPLNSSIILRSSVTDPGTADKFTYAWSVTKDGILVVSGAESGYTFTQPQTGIYLVRRIVTDDHGDTGTDVRTIFVGEPAEIRGTIWNDADGDGSRHPGEPGLADWTVYLDTNNNGQFDDGEPSQQTAPDGRDCITGLVPGSYNVAEVLQLGWAQTFRDWVIVGDPGNTADTTRYGAVANTFAIGRFEVTVAQYAEFLNVVAATDRYELYNTAMSTGSNGCQIDRTDGPNGYTYSVAADWTNRPANYVSFWDAVRYANWLHNGKPTGAQDVSTTEDGAYTINGYIGVDASHVGRNTSATYFIPSENEWYKASYYTGGGTTAGHWKYPTQSDDLPNNSVLTPDPGNCAIRGYEPTAVFVEMFDSWF